MYDDVRKKQLATLIRKKRIMNPALKKMLIILVILVVGLVLVRVSFKLEPVQNVMLNVLADQFAKTASEEMASPNSLRVFVCGSASPLGMSDQAQACIAVVTPEHFYVIDSGAGSTANLQGSGLPMNRLQGILLTHFHSDHIAEIYEVNLNSWVQGRVSPLKVLGPEGVVEIVEGVNSTYRLDRSYRSAHHGVELLVPELGVMRPQVINANESIRDGDLTITAYSASHPPIKPALGYRFDYQGRSVVISGDSLITEDTANISDGADLLLHDALSLQIVSKLSETANSAGLNRIGKIMADVMDYHASAESIVALSDKASIQQVAFYHLVPIPANILMEEIFLRGLPENYSIAKDGMWYELPIGSNEIIFSD